MEACLLITKTNKAPERKGKVLFINAVHEVKQEKTMAFLLPEHIEKIFAAYQRFESIENFAALVSIEDVLARTGNMAINLYIRPESHDPVEQISFHDAFTQWNKASDDLKAGIEQLFSNLK